MDVEIREITYRPQQNSLHVLAKTRLDNYPANVELKVLGDPESITRRVEAALGNRKLAKIVGENFNKVDVELVFGNVKLYKLRASSDIPRVHVIFYTPKDEDPFECIAKGCAHIGYLGIGPNFSIGKDFLRRLLARHTEGGVFTNIFSHGSTMIFGSVFLKLLRKPLESLGSVSLELEDKLIASAIRMSKRNLRQLKTSYAQPLLAYMGLPVSPRIRTTQIYDISHYREMFAEKIYPEKVAQIPGIPMYRLGYYENGLWIGIPCKSGALCHAIKLAIRLVGPYVAADNPTEYMNLLANEFKKRAERYYELTKRICRRHGICISKPPEEFPKIVYSTLSDVKGLSNMLREIYDLTKYELRRID